MLLIPVDSFQNDQRLFIVKFYYMRLGGGTGYLGFGGAVLYQHDRTLSTGSLVNVQRNS